MVNEKPYSLKSKQKARHVNEKQMMPEIESPNRKKVGLMK